MRPLLGLYWLLASCATYGDAEPPMEGLTQSVEVAKAERSRGFGGAPEADDAKEFEEAEAAPMAPPPAPAPRPRPSPGREKADKRQLKLAAADGDDGVQAEPAEPADEVATRSWFPESMLWEPLVETGDDGVAVVPLTVPDQLTTWRVLALAHDREGQQGGAVHSFDGTLPVYVEPVMPGWLFAGDELLLPVQAVNASGAAVAGRIEVMATGAVSGRGIAEVSLSAGGSTVRSLPLSVDAAGDAVVKATLFAGEHSDSAERRVRVREVGRPVEGAAGGVLSGERSFTVAAPDGADPRTDRVEVLVFPGPLAVVQAEVDRVAGGATSPYGAYGFAVATHARRLGASMGVDIDASTVRALQIVAWQRVVRAARAPSTGQAADLLLALRDVEGHELAEGLRDRLVQTVVAGQRADGTYSRDATSTAQRVVVETALAAMALPPSEQGARLRAAGAIERLMPQIDDAYTASVVVASGLVGPEVSEELRSVVVKALEERDGRYRLSVPPNVRNAWGAPVGLAEARVFAALALEGHDARGDLVAALMQDWSARHGFGAGGVDPLALKAVVEALPGVAAPVEVVLRADGRELARGMVDPTQPRVPVVLAGPLGGGTGALTLSAEPEVPGLAYVATRRSWVPWTNDDRVPGVDVEVSTRSLAAGRTGELVIEVAAPKGARLTLEQGLPAGVVVDEGALAGRLAGQLVGHSVQQGSLELRTRAFTAGEVMRLVVPVTPAFGGRFATEPLWVSVDGGPSTSLPPLVWEVVAEGA
jgi:hypothetical protein